MQSDRISSRKRSIGSSWTVHALPVTQTEASFSRFCRLPSPRHCRQHLNKTNSIKSFLLSNSVEHEPLSLSRFWRKWKDKREQSVSNENDVCCSVIMFENNMAHMYANTFSRPRRKTSEWKIICNAFDEYTPQKRRHDNDCAVAILSALEKNITSKARVRSSQHRVSAVHIARSDRPSTPCIVFTNCLPVYTRIATLIRTHFSLSNTTSE